MNKRITGMRIKIEETEISADQIIQLGKVLNAIQEIEMDILWNITINKSYISAKCKDFRLSIDSIIGGTIFYWDGKDHKNTLKEALQSISEQLENENKEK